MAAWLRRNAMLGSLTYQMALQLRDDRLRAAERRRALAGPRPRTARSPKRPSWWS
jgi:hypothetical protein